jgi:5-methyltetrahydrofolate--homocysteine methyltransferase
MTDLLSRMLAERDWLLADGATGTNLFNMGLSSGDAPELWNETAPDKIRALYKGAVDAGSRSLFLTNSFGGNASRLKLHDAQKRVRELSRVRRARPRDRRCRGTPGDRRGLGRPDGRDHGADGQPHP